MQFLTCTFSVEFYNLGQCGNKECPFLHIDPEAKIKDCAWYDLVRRKGSRVKSLQQVLPVVPSRFSATNFKAKCRKFAVKLFHAFLR